MIRYFAQVWFHVVAKCVCSVLCIINPTWLCNMKLMETRDALIGEQKVKSLFHFICDYVVRNISTAAACLQLKKHTGTQIANGCKWTAFFHFTGSKVPVYKRTNIYLWSPLLNKTSENACPQVCPQEFWWKPRKLYHVLEFEYML